MSKYCHRVLLAVKLFGLFAGFYVDWLGGIVQDYVYSEWFSHFFQL